MWIPCVCREYVHLDLATLRGKRDADISSDTKRIAGMLAAADVLLEESMPPILDDVFAFYDDKRLESALKWLSRQGKQVIIFTCHKREEELVKRVVCS